MTSDKSVAGQVADASGVDHSGQKAFVFWRSMLLVALLDIATKDGRVRR